MRASLQGKPPCLEEEEDGEDEDEEDGEEEDEVTYP